MSAAHIRTNVAGMRRWPTSHVRSGNTVRVELATCSSQTWRRASGVICPKLTRLLDLAEDT